MKMNFFCSFLISPSNDSLLCKNVTALFSSHHVTYRHHGSTSVVEKHNLVQLTACAWHCQVKRVMHLHYTCCGNLSIAYKSTWHMFNHLYHDLLSWSFWRVSQCLLSYWKVWKQGGMGCKEKLVLMTAQALLLHSPTKFLTEWSR